jgi:stress response protein YsnF
MKYWNELTLIENELIQLEMVLSTVRSLGVAAQDGLQVSDIQNCLFMIEQNLEHITKNVGENFQNLWETVREDSWKNETGDVEIDRHVANELTDVVNGWVSNV